MAANVETIAWAGETPWHGLGVEVPFGLTPNEMIDAAGLNWHVKKHPMFTDTGVAVEGYGALVRDKDSHVLGICGPEYTPFQNREVFAFFKKFTDAGHMVLETAGSLNHGKNVWALARINALDFTLNGNSNDKVNNYMLLNHPHQWGKALSIMFTSIRVVCCNTLTMALASGKEKFSAMHVQEFGTDTIRRAEEALGIAELICADYKDNVILLSKVKAERAQVTDYIARLFQPDMYKEKPTEDTILSPLDFNRRAGRVFDLLNVAPGNELSTAKGTWWGALNAITYYVDHDAGQGDRNIALHNAWFGQRAGIKRVAYNLAVEYAKAA
jgi:phage/plasmid-like protein (TIGR03299 family)